jgi:hypothetical protein
MMRAHGAAAGGLDRRTAGSTGIPAGTRGAGIIIDRLHGVRSTGPGRWLARCPAHEDRSPSLSIRELDDGRVLIHDFGGCSTHAVLDAIGLDMGALFPARLPGSGPAGGFQPTHSRISAADGLRALDHEITVAAMILNDALADPRTFTRANRVRLDACVRRIGAIRDLCVPQEVRHVG